MANTYNLYEFKDLTRDKLREIYRAVTGLDNDNEFTDEKIHEYLLNALYEEK